MTDALFEVIVTSIHFRVFLFSLMYFTLSNISFYASTGKFLVTYMFDCISTFSGICHLLFLLAGWSFLIYLFYFKFLQLNH